MSPPSGTAPRYTIAGHLAVLSADQRLPTVMAMKVIEVTNLHKRYRDQVAVDDVSFAVDEGEIFGVLGPNGAGKTTTVECVAGLRTPTSGTITVGGRTPLEAKHLLGV